MRLRRGLARRPDGPKSFQLPRRPQLLTLAGYAVAAAAYVAFGVWQTTFLLSWYVAAGYLLLVIWLVPAAVRRLS